MRPHVRRFPGRGAAWSWLMDYADALAGEHGEDWQEFAQAHVPSGRTDSTSWKKWRDECLSTRRPTPLPSAGGSA